MKKHILLFCILIGVLSPISTVDGQVQVIKPETPMTPLDYGATPMCYPDVTELKGTQEFVVGYPHMLAGTYHAVYRKFDYNGNLINTRPVESLISTSVNKYGIGVASNFTLISCIYPQKGIGSGTYDSYGEQFLHSGIQSGLRFLMASYLNSSPDGTFRATMPSMFAGQNTVFASENRVEYLDSNGLDDPDHDVITSEYHGESELGSYYKIDTNDLIGEDDNYFTDATSLDCYAETYRRQWLLFSWTGDDPTVADDNNVFIRAGRYDISEGELSWVQSEPFKVSDVYVGPYSQSWTDVDLTRNNDFIVVWNQVESDQGIYVSKFNYQGNQLPGYPKPLYSPPTPQQTLFPSVLTLPSGGPVSYIVTWAHKIDGYWKIVGLGVRENDTILHAFQLSDNTTLGGGNACPQHKMDTIYCPTPDNDRFAITFHGEEDGEWNI